MTALAAAIEAQRGSYPTAARVISQILEEASSLLGPGIAFMVERRPSFWAEAERLLGLSLALGGDPVTALIEYTLAYLKEQAAFMESGAYSNTDFDAVRREVYDNAEVMRSFYLDGLMLTHAFWPIHFDIHEFFEAELLSRLPETGTGTEIGFGHGLYLLEMLSARPRTRAHAFDISEHSLSYAARLLEQGGVAPSRFRLELADARARLPAADAAFDFAVFAEILEHVPDPAFSLAELRRVLRPGAPVFLTTVVDSNAIDHITLFRDPAEVPPLLAAAGFELVAEKVLRVRDYVPSRDPSIDVAYVCRAREP